MHPWLVAITWPRYERRVARSLARYGFAFYLPKYKTHHQRVALLFPRYIFAGPTEEWPAWWLSEEGEAQFREFAEMPTEPMPQAYIIWALNELRHDIALLTLAIHEKE